MPPGYTDDAVYANGGNPYGVSTNAVTDGDIADTAKAAAEKAKNESELEDIRKKRAAEREKISGKRATVTAKEVSKTPAAVQKTWTDKMIENLDWIHRRA